MRWPAPLRRAGGYTVLELLIAAVIATTGLFASLNMTTTVTNGTTNMRDISDGQTLAEHLLASMQSQGLVWVDNQPHAVAVELGKVPQTTGETSQWQVLNSNPFSNDKRIGRLGNNIIWDNGLLLRTVDGSTAYKRARYCAHYRVTRVGDDLARVEVRVTWARSHIDPESIKTCPVTMVGDAQATVRYHTVSVAGTIMRNIHANRIGPPLF